MLPNDIVFVEQSFNKLSNVAFHLHCIGMSMHDKHQKDKAHDPQRGFQTGSKFHITLIKRLEMEECKHLEKKNSD